jgi:predicted alpha/beta-hydrolase family hydrolase
MTASASQELAIAVNGAVSVSGLLLRPPGAEFLLVLAHGAGAGMRHPFLELLAHELCAADVATLRYQFPYMERRRRVPDSPGVAAATVEAAVRAAAEAAGDLPLFAGGKSFGGRMTALAASEQKLENVRGLVFVGFPLHAPNQPGIKRAEPLREVKQPMLVLQGTRDAFADLKLLRPICAELGSRATLHIVENADHSFHMPKGSGRSDAEVIRELAQTVAEWCARM